MTKTKEQETEKFDRDFLEQEKLKLEESLRRKSFEYPELHNINGLIFLKDNALSFLSNNHAKHDLLINQLLEFAKTKAISLIGNDNEFRSFPEHPSLTEYIESINLDKSDRNWNCNCKELGWHNLYK